MFSTNNCTSCMQYALEWLGHQDPKLPCLEGKIGIKKAIFVPFCFCYTSTYESETFVA